VSISPGTQLLVVEDL